MRFAAVIRLPAQIVRSGRRLIYRLLSDSPWQQPLLARSPPGARGHNVEHPL
jgi:hypothetical protein